MSCSLCCPCMHSCTVGQKARRRTLGTRTRRKHLSCKALSEYAFRWRKGTPYNGMPTHSWFLLDCSRKVILRSTTPRSLCCLDCWVSTKYWELAGYHFGTSVSLAQLLSCSVLLAVAHCVCVTVRSFGVQVPHISFVTCISVHKPPETPSVVQSIRLSWHLCFTGSCQLSECAVRVQQ